MLRKLPLPSITRTYIVHHLKLTDVREDQCDFSKKLILCLEEKAKRVSIGTRYIYFTSIARGNEQYSFVYSQGCEDWELAENSNYTTNFNNFNKKFEERSYNDGGGTMLRLKYR